MFSEHLVFELSVYGFFFFGERPSFTHTQNSRYSVLNLITIQERGHELKHNE